MNILEMNGLELLKEIIKGTIPMPSMTKTIPMKFDLSL